MENFEVTSGKMVLSDPCYELGTWCQGVIDNVKNGTWVGSVKMSDEGEWGIRVSSLASYNEEFFDKNPKLKENLFNLIDVEELNFNGGVDSGQFGHFDFDTYRKDNLAIDLPKAFDDDYSIQEGDEWYRVCCHYTLEDDFGCVPSGVVSSTGFGDGSYPTFAIKDDNGQYVGFITIFISFSGCGG